MCGTIIKGSDGLNSGVCEKCSYVDDLCKKCGGSIISGNNLVEELKDEVEECKTNLSYHVQEKMDKIDESLNKFVVDLEGLLTDKDHDGTIAVLKDKDWDTKIQDELAKVVFN
jgi:hypothetical protein